MVVIFSYNHSGGLMNCNLSDEKYNKFKWSELANHIQLLWFNFLFLFCLLFCLFFIWFNLILHLFHYCWFVFLLWLSRYCWFVLKKNTLKSTLNFMLYIILYIKYNSS